MGQRSGRPEDGLAGSFRSEMDGMADPGVPTRRPRAGRYPGTWCLHGRRRRGRPCIRSLASGMAVAVFFLALAGEERIDILRVDCPALMRVSRLPCHASICRRPIRDLRGPSLRRAMTAGRTGFGAEPRYGGDDDVARDGRDAFGRGHECGRRFCWCRPACPHRVRRSLIRVSRPAPPCDQRDGQHRQPVDDPFGAERH